MPADLQQSPTDEQWGGFWDWARGADPGPIDTRPVDVIVPDEPSITDDASELIWNAMDPWGYLGINTDKKAATGKETFSGNAGKALGTMLGYAVLAGVGYLVLKDALKLNLSSKAT